MEDFNKKNKEHILKKRQEYYGDNREAKIQYQAERYRKADKEKINTAARKRNYNRRKTDLDFKIREQLRCRMNRAIKNGAKAGSAVRDLGCSIEYFKQYIAVQFQSGMSWDNWGYETWHLDHKIPLAIFDLTNRKQFLKACHYTNLQPMWGIANIKKGAKLKY